MNLVLFEGQPDRSAAHAGSDDKARGRAGVGTGTVLQESQVPTGGVGPEMLLPILPTMAVTDRRTVAASPKSAPVLSAGYPQACQGPASRQSTASTSG